MTAVYELKEKLFKKVRRSRDETSRYALEYMNQILAIPKNKKYHYRPESLIEFYNKLKALYGLNGIQNIHQIVMLNLMENHQKIVSPIRFPKSLQDQFELEFSRIIHQIGSSKSYLYDWSNDSFAKDIGVCAARLLPIGPGVLGLGALQRNLLLKKGVRQFFSFLYLWLFRLGWHSPLLESHLYLANVGQFNPKGWEKAYSIIADILELNPHIKGMFRGSWFIDPEISIISPKLAYLREVPAKHGAVIFFSCVEDENCGAFARSLSRKKLYDEGKYIPKSYVLVWPRADIINKVKLERDA